MALRAPVARAAPRAAPRSAPRRVASPVRATPRRVLRAAGGGKPWGYHEGGFDTDAEADYDEEPSQDRPGHVFHPPRRVTNSEEEQGDAEESAAPLVLSPRLMYRDAHHSLDAMIAALEAERDALLLLRDDGWTADAWNTGEFAALRPGGRSRWRVAGGGATARRGGRSLLIRSRAADGAAGSMEFADGPYEQH